MNKDKVKGELPSGGVLWYVYVEWLTKWFEALCVVLCCMHCVVSCSLCYVCLPCCFSGVLSMHSWWVVDNVVWTNSWSSIVGASWASFAWYRWRTSAKGLYMCGLWGVERQVGLVQGTRWPTGSSAGRTVARKAKWSREHRVSSR
jgi:hypothetical protein